MRKLTHEFGESGRHFPRTFPISNANKRGCPTQRTRSTIHVASLPAAGRPNVSATFALISASAWGGWEKFIKVSTKTLSGRTVAIKVLPAELGAARWVRP